jgi:hypothetical protein
MYYFPAYLKAQRSLFCIASLLGCSSLLAANLVTQGPAGLQYTPYANQGQANAVNTVPDFSRAGYMGGGVPIPFIPTAITLMDDGPSDDTARIQAAIDELSNDPLVIDPVLGAYRGAILLRAGEYTVSSTLRIEASGIVIRGEGQHAAGTVIEYTETAPSIANGENLDLNLFVFEGASDPNFVFNSQTNITDAYVPVGATAFTVDSAAPPYAAGDLILITNLMNQQWIDDIGMTVAGGLTGDAEDPVWEPSGFQLETFRHVVGVAPSPTNPGSESIITLDAPLVQAIETQYGGGKVEKFTYSGAIENVGIEGLRLVSSFQSDEDENHGWRAIRMQKVLNGWVRQVTSRYFGMGLILINGDSMFITVEDSACLDPKSQTAGGRKYSFHLDQSTYILFQRCITRGGRHDYVSGSRSAGPNVFVDSMALEAKSDIGPHFRYATGELYDNIKTNDQINVQNRLNSGTSHGWSGAQIMFWNIDAAAIYCDAPTGAMNWSIGAIGEKRDSSVTPDEPFGIWQSENVPVAPRSLYYAQLDERLGSGALQSVILPQQREATLWQMLEAWTGDGLLLDPLIVWSDETANRETGVPIPVRGILRDLVMLESGYSVTWSRLSGSGNVVFADDAALETTASFDEGGSHQLQLVVDDGSNQLVATLRLIIARPGDLTPPAAPTSLAVTADSEAIQLTWDPNSEVDFARYLVYRSTTQGVVGSPIETHLYDSQFTDAEAEYDVTYYYTVRAVDGNDNLSSLSAERSGQLVTPLSVPVAVTDNAYVYADDAGVALDADEELAFKNRSWESSSRFAYLRFPLSSPNKIGFKTAAQLSSVSLDLSIIEHDAGDTLYVYGLVDGANFSPSNLSETTWTGGSNGLVSGGNNLIAANRPDGPQALPNPLTTVLLGSYTFAGANDNDDVGLKQVEFSNLPAFREMIGNDTNGELTLILSSQNNSAVGRIASLHNTNAHPVPTLSLSSGAPTGVTAVAGDAFVSLDWDDSLENDFGTFSVFRSLSPGSGYSEIASGLTESHFLDASLTNSTPYYYFVRAISTQMDSQGDSFEVSAMPTAVLFNSLAVEDNAYIRRDREPQNSDDRLRMKRLLWENDARLAYLRFDLSGDAAIANVNSTDLIGASLEVYVLNHPAGDTLRVYGVLDSAAELSWTGGDGTPEGGNTLESSTRPDGEQVVPNAATTALLGSYTLDNSADNSETGLISIPLQDLAAFQSLINDDSNGSITLILGASLDTGDSQIASLFNNSGDPVPTLSLQTGNDDADTDSIADTWEILNFSFLGSTDGSPDTDGDGVSDFFEYLYGSDPQNSNSTGFALIPNPNPGSVDFRFDWAVEEPFTLGQHYRAEISYDLVSWTDLGQITHTRLPDSSDDGIQQMSIELDITPNTRVFLRLTSP